MPFDQAIGAQPGKPLKSLPADRFFAKFRSTSTRIIVFQLAVGGRQFFQDLVIQRRRDAAKTNHSARTKGWVVWSLVYPALLRRLVL